MRYIIFTLLTILCLFAKDVNASGLPSHVEHLGLRNGLSNDFVTDIAQDKHGFLWIGTEAGLNRFDGENFRVFSERNTVLKGNAINALFYDEKTDRLWIGSKKGLDVFDCKTLKFETLDLPAGMGKLNVNGFARAADGGIYILNHYDFIMHCDGSAKTFKVYRQKDLPGLPMSFRSIADDGHGHLYIGHDKYGLSVVDLRTKKIERFVHEDGKAVSLPGNSVKDIFIDRLGRVWLGTDRGMALFNTATKTFHAFSTGLADSGCRNVYSIMESRDGMLWAGCNPDGVYVLDIRNLSLPLTGLSRLTALSLAGGHGGIASDKVYSVFQDSFGNVWIGYYGGGLDFVSRTQPLFSMLPYFGMADGVKNDKPAWAMYAGRDGKVWVGGESEIWVFDKGKVWRKYDLSHGIGTTRGGIVALAWLGDEMLFSSFENGVFSLNTGSGSVRNIGVPGRHNYASSLVTIGGKAYMGMQDGLYVYESGKVRKLEKISAAIYNLIPNGIAVDRQGKLWVGTYGAGVFVFDKHGRQVARLDDAHGLSSNAIRQLLLDTRGWMWVAGQDGLSLIKDTRRLRSIVSYGYDDGLSDINIHALQEDTDGNIWLSTDNGLARWNGKTSEIDLYDYHDGLPYSNFMDRAACRTADGTLYFGSMNGVCIFQPRMFHHLEQRVPVRIVECQSFVSQEGSSDSVVTYAGSDGKATVPYDIDYLRVIFSVPDYSQSRFVEYSYMVEGLDHNWIKAGREHEVTLRNLAPGKYVFKVRARLRGQEWNDANIATMTIEVIPPLWLTWYAKMFYVLAVIAIIYVIVRVYKFRLQLKNSLEEERRKSIGEKRLNDERLRFYTNITHELRTPLTLILGPLEDLVGDDGLQEAYKKRVRTIYSSALRLLSLVNNILDFRKTETENRQLVVTKGNVSTLVKEIGLRYKELNRNPDVEIRLDIDNNVPEIYFDGDVLTTILSNLMSNAVKYTPKGYIRLSLGMVSEAGVKLVEMSVTDTGYGIEANALPHVFDRYYQAEGQYQASGTGIGLALVKALSDLHGGSLSVSSKVGEGTSFTLRLKADDTYPNALHKESSDRQQTHDNDRKQKDVTGQRPVILVVEDNDDIREYISSSLQPKYDVVSAPNGKKGLELAQKYIPDIIISDIMMPVMDGIEMCRGVKGDISTCHIPVILLTAKDTISDKEAGYDVGADSYLTKPFSAKLLMSRINNLLESRRVLATAITASMNGTPDGQKAAATGEKEDVAAPSPLKLNKMDEEFIGRFTKIVEDNITLSELDMTFMQKALSMSHSTLYRKLKSLTGMSGNEFIRRIRLKRGYDLLCEGRNVSETAYSCGFNDVGYFRNCFKEEYGMSPSQLIKQRKGRELAS